MEAIVKRWCRTCGTLMLLTAIVLSAAWVKSCLDNASDPANPSPLMLTGRIGILGSSNPVEPDGVPPQIQWSVIGLFTPVTIRLAPEPVVHADQVISISVPVIQDHSATRPGEKP